METTAKLPPIEDFHSKLYGEDFNQTDYDHAQKVWEAFECKNLGEYSDIYFKVDVLLHADIFQRRRAKDGTDGKRHIKYFDDNNLYGWAM